MLILGHSDIFTFSVALLKLYGVFNLLLVVQFLIKTSILEYSSIRYSSHEEFHEIDTLFDVTVSLIVAGSGSIVQNNNNVISRT